MGKTRNRFKKIGDIRGTFHARMGMVKGRIGKDLTKAESLGVRPVYWGTFGVASRVPSSI